MACRAELGGYTPIVAINQKIINYTLYLQNKENDCCETIFFMSADLLVKIVSTLIL